MALSLVGADLDAKWRESLCGNASTGQLYYGAGTELMELKDTLVVLRRSIKAKDSARLSASLRSKREEAESRIVKNRVRAARALQENRIVREEEVKTKHEAAEQRLMERVELSRVQQYSRVMKNAEYQARACRNRLSRQRHLEDVQLEARQKAAEKVRERINRAKRLVADEREPTSANT